MAAISSGGQSPATTAIIEPPAQTQSTVKLRGSCHACALSKLKCSQDKPTCARCAKRGTACQYLASRRAGRKQGSRSGTLKKQPTLSQDDRKDILAASTHLMQYALHQDRALDLQTHRERHHPRTPSYPDSVPSLLSAGPATSATTPMAFNADLDPFLSPVSLSLLDIPGMDYFAGADVNFRDLSGFGPASFLIPDNPLPILEDVLPKPHQPASPRSNWLGNPTTTGLHCAPPTEPPQRCCLIRALSLFRQLFPSPPSTTCTTASASASPTSEDSDKETKSNPHHQQNEEEQTHYPTIQKVITQNEQIIREITHILDCSCSQDGYTLAILTLTVFKVLAWYGAAAQEPAVQSPSTPLIADQHAMHMQTHMNMNMNVTMHWEQIIAPRRAEQVIRGSAVIGSYRLDGEEQGRMAAQLVLSELHRVQRLVNTLSQRLREQGLRDGLLTKANSVGVDGHEAVLPVNLLDQLAVDLRERLRGLSAGIVEVLRSPTYLSCSRFISYINTFYIDGCHVGMYSVA